MVGGVHSPAECFGVSADLGFYVNVALILYLDIGSHFVSGVFLLVLLRCVEEVINKVDGDRVEILDNSSSCWNISRRRHQVIMTLVYLIIAASLSLE